MKRTLLLILISGFFLINSQKAFATLKPGTIAHDFTLTDINGQSWNLYTILAAGKTVFLEFGTTWCGPCWSYHQTHALRDLYNMYGPGGTNEVMVFMIECDTANNLACLFGPAGCTGPYSQTPSKGSLGDFVTGTPFPIIDLDAKDHIVTSWYDITQYPTIYSICPNKKVYVPGQVSTAELYSYVSSCSLDMVIDLAANIKCYDAKNGSIQISVIKGAAPLTYNWSNGATTQDIYGLGPGTYTVTVTDANGFQIVSNPITLTEPPKINIITDLVTNEGCVGNKGGKINISTSGGVPGYQYKWNNGATTQDISGLSAGTYLITITDNIGCTVTHEYLITALSTPYAEAGPEGVINCFEPAIELEGDGPNDVGVVYHWTTTNGHILQSPNSLNPKVDKAGTYKLKVTNIYTGCFNEDVVLVTNDFTPAVSKAGDDGLLDCKTKDITLDGTKSSPDGDFSFNWQTLDGSIISGASTNQAKVNKPGTYTLIVTNEISGCTASDDVVVKQNILAPDAIIAKPSIIDCTNNIVELDGSNSSKGGTISYNWYTTNGNILSGNNETHASVNAAGNYFLVLNDNSNYCSDTAFVAVLQDAAVPLAIPGSNAELNCNVPIIILDGSQSSQGNNITVSWTTINGNILIGADTYTPIVDKAGLYTLLITNIENGCSALATITITQGSDNVPSAIYSYTTNLLTVSFKDASTGQPDTYLWTFGDGTTSTEKDPVHTYAIDGTYEVCLTTKNICGIRYVCNFITVTGNINIPTVSKIGITNATCKGGSDGCIDLSIINGTAPYTFNWSNGMLSEDPCQIPAGNYSVTVTDANGVSTISNNIIVTELYFVNINKSLSITPDCNANNGAITLDINTNGGVLNYKWSHDPNLNNSVAENLAEGNYTVIATDEHGCTSSITVELLDSGQRINSIVNDVKCFGDNTGSINITITKGTAPYTYLWNTGETTEDIPDLSSGIYFVEVTDSEGCVKKASIEISEPLDITGEIIATNSQQGKDNGIAELQVNGGTSPYTYLWNNGASSSKIDNLAPGDYNVVVTDANGCTKKYTVTITEITGTSNLDILNEFKVFPNPSNGNFKVEVKFNEASNSQLSISNILGQVIYKKRFETDLINETINLGEVPNGSYTIRITANKGQHSEQIIIHK